MANQTISDDIAIAKAREVLAKLDLDEKVSLLAGCATMYLNAIPEAGITREWAFSDSTHMIKPEHSRMDWDYLDDVDNSCTVMPAASALAMTWNIELAAQHGDVMAEQMRACGKDQMLGPGLNINRTPRCGRNWEYISEDPYLTAKLAVPMIKAIQSHGVAATAKHYCLNNQELNRLETNAVADERTLHEIYLPAFRAAIEEGEVLSIMTSYNKFNGVHTSENSYLLKGLARDRFGFKGTFVSDWGGHHSCVMAALNGATIEMHYGQGIEHFVNLLKGTKPLADAVRDEKIPEATIDEMALRVLYVMAKTGFLDNTQEKGERHTEKHKNIAVTIAEESIVLLKNDANILPLKKSTIKNVAVVGMQADLSFCRFGCSCEARPKYEISAFQGLKDYLGNSANVKLYPLGNEGASDGQPVRIPLLSIDTFRTGANGAFAQRAWEKYEWTPDQKTWVDNPVLVGYVDYPQGGLANAMRFIARFIPTETGSYQFSVQKGAKISGITIKVNSKVVFNISNGVAVQNAIELTQGDAAIICIDVAGSAQEESFEFGYLTPTMLSSNGTKKLEEIKNADAVIIFTGTRLGYGQGCEQEGQDLPNVLEPPGHNEEIASLLKLGLKNLIIINRSGTQLEMPFAKDCHTLIQMSYLGNNGGLALPKILFGDVTPSAKLASTIFNTIEDTAVYQMGTYASEESVYKERFYVGYRWYDTKNIAPLFPFGHGLSYTTFEYGKITQNALTLSLDITNIGNIAGKEVVQLYIRPINSPIERPFQELKGFVKTAELCPGAKENVTFHLTLRDFAFYDDFLHRWHTLPGEYEIRIGASSRDIRQTHTLKIESEATFI